jgi:hypothetical protein
MPQSVADLLQSVPMSPNLSQSLGRAQEFAREQAHRALLLEHLLLALTEDPDASAVLKACNVDLVKLSTDVSGYLGGLLEDMRAEPGTEPNPDAELLRVLEAARQAAQQSRRRAIDGAIVLAAIVGDGKSPAAGLLKTHGMTFEEAIRTLQKASAQARSKQFAASGARAQPERPAAQEAEQEATPRAPERPAAQSAAAAQPSSSGQSVDEILAAARARIQSRYPGAAGKAEAKLPAEPGRKDEPKDELPLMSLSSFTASRPPAQAEPPAPDGRHGQPEQAGPPPAPPGPGMAMPPPAERLPPDVQGPPPLRAFQRPGEGGGPPPPPPPPPPPGRGGPPPRGDGSDALGPAPPRWPAGANGAAGPPRRPPPSETTRPARPGAAARGGQRTPPGPLIEAIPRRMRVGAAATAQVRIGRDKVDSLMQLLTGGRVQHHPEAVVARVLSVRLKAPDGGFAIEAATPETQWIETAAGPQQDEHVSWRWTVTPQKRGRRRLQLVVAARTIGRDGIAAETAPPDRTIEVAVRPRLLRRLLRWTAFLLLFGVGAALGRLSHDKLAQDFVDLGTSLFKHVLGLLVTSGFLSG